VVALAIVPSVSTAVAAALNKEWKSSSQDLARRTPGRDGASESESSLKDFVISLSFDVSLDDSSAFQLTLDPSIF
jgi:hypothetical protein